MFHHNHFLQREQLCGDRSLVAVYYLNLKATMVFFYSLVFPLSCMIYTSYQPAELTSHPTPHHHLDTHLRLERETLIEQSRVGGFSTAQNRQVKSAQHLYQPQPLSPVGPRPEVLAEDQVQPLHDTVIHVPWGTGSRRRHQAAGHETRSRVHVGTIHRTRHASHPHGLYPVLYTTIVQLRNLSICASVCEKPAAQEQATEAAKPQEQPARRRLICEEISAEAHPTFVRSSAIALVQPDQRDGLVCDTQLFVVEMPQQSQHRAHFPSEERLQAIQEVVAPASGQQAVVEGLLDCDRKEFTPAGGGHSRISRDGLNSALKGTFELGGHRPQRLLVGQRTGPQQVAQRPGDAGKGTMPAGVGRAPERKRRPLEEVQHVRDHWTGVHRLSGMNGSLIRATS